MYLQLKQLIDFFISPFLELITDMGINDKSIKLGIGQVEFFDFTLYELTELVLSFLVIIFFMTLIYKLLRIVIRIITGGAL